MITPGIVIIPRGTCKKEAQNRYPDFFSVHPDDPVDGLLAHHLLITPNSCRVHAEFLWLITMAPKCLVKGSAVQWLSPEERNVFLDWHKTFRLD